MNPRIDDASFLAVGYSPTGGGHTGRTLNIVHRALDDKLLKPVSFEPENAFLAKVLSGHEDTKTRCSSSAEKGP